MKHQPAIRPETAGLLNLSQINQAISPLRIDAQGLAAYGFAPTTTYMSAKYYHPAELPHMRRTLALRALWPEGEAIIKTLDKAVAIGKGETPP